MSKLMLPAIIKQRYTVQIPEGFTPIYTWQDLHNVRDDVSADYILMNNLDSNSTGYSTYGANWEPISNTDFGGFTGRFDGNGKIISDLKMDYTEFQQGRNGFGMFGAIGPPCLIENLGLRNIDYNIKTSGAISGDIATGGLVAYALDSFSGLATIENCFVDGGEIRGTSYIGAFLGWGMADIRDCYANINITHSTDGDGGDGMIRPSGFQAVAQYMNQTGPFTGTSLDRCYSACTIDDSMMQPGVSPAGILFLDDNSSIDASSVFWDTDIGPASAGDISAFGRATSLMQRITTYIAGPADPDPYDIVAKQNHDGKEDTAIWFIDHTNDYPRLWFER